MKACRDLSKLDNAEHTWDLFAPSIFDSSLNQYPYQAPGNFCNNFDARPDWPLSLVPAYYQNQRDRDEIYVPHHESLNSWDTT